MPETITLHFETRIGSGSRDARKLRRAGRIPGTLFGHGDSQAITLEAVSFRRQIKPEHYGSTMVTLTDGNQSETALVKEVQTDMLKNEILHISLQRVVAGDRVTISVPVLLHGEPLGVRAGGVLEQVVHSVNLRCGADQVPSHLDYDVSSLDVNDNVHAAQLALPAGVELLDHADQVIAVVLAPTVPALEEPTRVDPGVTGPELTREKQQEDFPSER